jgi:hypothetical protein
MWLGTVALQWGQYLSDVNCRQLLIGQTAVS